MMVNIGYSAPLYKHTQSASPLVGMMGGNHARSLDQIITQKKNEKSKKYVYELNCIIVYRKLHVLFQHLIIFMCTHKYMHILGNFIYYFNLFIFICLYIYTYLFASSFSIDNSSGHNPVTYYYYYFFNNLCKIFLI